ncbi:MAG: sensor histidine kinase [Clostridia bacterium]|nr:sensor histidine kinase [Clostridia bacterium]
MKELSLNILDITENSLKAGSTLTHILLTETKNTLTIVIKDNGCGMSSEMCKNVINPFFTTRTTRKVGFGIPFFKLVAEQTGGSFKIESKSQKEFPKNHGTCVTAVFNKNHIDYTPLGDIVSTVITLIQGHPESDFYFKHTVGEGEVLLNTQELRQVLGDDINLNEFEILNWIKDFLKEQYENL